MRTTKTRPVVGSFLSRLGFFTAVVAIIGGLLGMHVIAGFHAGSMAPAPIASPSAPAPPTVPNMVSDHASSPHELSVAGPVAGHATHEQPGGPVTCGGSPADGHSFMAGHGSCIPSFGPDAMGVPLPGMHTWLHVETPFAIAPGPKSKGRVPDPPSLIQLSVNRT